MTNVTEKKITDLYQAYQHSRKIPEVVSTAGEESNLNIETQSYNDSEKQVVSLYHQFQNDRIPNREKIINSVIQVAKAHISESEKEKVESTDSVLTSVRLTTANTATVKSIWEFVQSIFTITPARQWQTAAAFSLILIVSGLVSVNYLMLEKQSTDQLVSIPDVFYDRNLAIAANIQPIQVTHLGFSSNQGRGQIAFRLGVLSVDLPLLARMDNQTKLQQVLMQARLAIDSNNKIQTELGDVISQVEMAKSQKDKITLVNKFVLLIHNNYIIDEDMYSIAAFGKWLEITLLSTNLSDEQSKPLLGKLMSQRNEILDRVSIYLSNETGALKHIEKLKNVAIGTEMSQSAKLELQNTLQYIKAILI